MCHNDADELCLVGHTSLRYDPKFFTVATKYGQGPKGAEAGHSDIGNLGADKGKTGGDIGYVIEGQI